MNFLQKTMLTKVADQMKKNGTPLVLINFNLEPDDPLFFTPLKETDTIADKATVEYLVNFYAQNKKI